MMQFSIWILILYKKKIWEKERLLELFPDQFDYYTFKFGGYTLQCYFLETRFFFSVFCRSVGTPCQYPSQKEHISGDSLLDGPRGEAC